jgi:hypothetical protein
MVVLNAMPRIRSPIAHWFGAPLFGVLLVLASVNAAAQPADLQAPEYRVKAAFVYKFGDYIEWPADAFPAANSPLVIGVVGADALAEELTKISTGRTINGRPVAVRKLKNGDSLGDLHVIFLGRAEGGQLASELDASKGRATLTITESADGIRLGSMINFVVVSDKVRFDVALPSAAAGRLKISSRLLAVARKVVASPP